MLTDKKEQRSEYQIHHHHQKNGHHHRSRGGAPDLFRTRSRDQSFVTTHGSNGHAKHHTFYEPADNVPQEKGIHGGLNVTNKGEVRLRHAKQGSAHYAHGVGPDGQAGQHDDHGQKFRRHQKMDGIDRHGFQRINFFRNLHRADLRR